MKLCWHCGKKYSDEKGSFTMCHESYSELARFGDEQFSKFSRSLYTLMNHDMIEEDIDLLAQSAIGAKLAEMILKAMPSEEAVKLLRRIMP